MWKINFGVYPHVLRAKKFIDFIIFSDGFLPSEILLQTETLINFENFDGTFHFDTFGGS